jgi:PAS domain S-box-containing protein
MSPLPTSDAVHAKLVWDSQIAIVVSTLADGRILEVNDSFVDLLGYARDEMIGQTSAGLGLWVDPEQRAQLAAALVAGQPLRDFEATVRTKSGAERQVLAAVTVIEIDCHACLLTQAYDVTAYRQIETRFRALVRNSYDVITILDPDGTRRYVSPSIERLLGYSPDELLDRSPVDLVHPDDAPRLQEAIASFGRGVKETSVLEVRFRHRNGSWRDFEAIGSNLLAEPGVAGIVFNSRDITRRKAAEAALRESEERFRSAFAHAATGMALIAEDGRFLQVNQCLCTILASSEAELLGTSFAEITLAEDRNVDGDLAQQLLRGEIASYQVEKRLVRKPDEVIWGRITVSLVRGSAGEPLYFVAQIQDITPFKAAGAALRESEERFRRAFDHAPIGMSLVAQDGHFILVNRALCDMVGYSEEELLGKTFLDITYPEDVANNLELFKRLWAGELDAYQLEKRYLRKDGGVIWIHLTGSIVRDANGPRNGIAQIVDITDRRHLEMDRAIMHASEREYTRQLRALTEMRADLTAMIAHELRAPVAALRMMTFLLATGELSSQAEGEMFAAVKGEIERLDRLIDDVAEVTSAEREDFSVQLNPVRLNALFENAAAYAHVALEDHPFTGPPALDVRVWCDAERISQVLRNLLDNAAKHTPSGTPVALRAHREDTRVRMEVVDRGPGLPAEDVALIFEKFGRGHQAAELQTPGAGLGLYLSRQIVEAHGSELTVASAPATGTVFAFDLEVVS